jgi:hypothetical protein
MELDNTSTSSQPVWAQPTGPSVSPSYFQQAASPSPRVGGSWASGEVLDVTIGAAPKKRRFGLLAGAVAAVTALGVGAFLVLPRPSEANFDFASAGATTLQAESINMTFEVKMAGVPRVEFDGVIDVASGIARAELPIEEFSPGTEGSIDYVFAQDAVYIRYPDSDELPQELRMKWIRMGADEVLDAVGAQPTPMTGSNPLKVLEGVRESGEAEDLGFEDLDGEQVKRYEIPPLVDGGDKSDVLVDADNRVREISFSVNLDGLVPGSGTVDYTIRYLDFGGPVEITVPNEADTIPWSEAMEILGL